MRKRLAHGGRELALDAHACSRHAQAIVIAP
jgi:hypothetical protein